MRSAWIAAGCRWGFVLCLVACGTDTMAQAPVPASRQTAPPTEGNPWRRIANWTGSADATTKMMDVPSGELRLVLLAVPNGAAARLTVTVLDERQKAVHLVTWEGLEVKRMDFVPVPLNTARVSFVVASTDVLWGLWAETRNAADED